MDAVYPIPEDLIWQPKVQLQCRPSSGPVTAGHSLVVGSGCGVQNKSVDPSSSGNFGPSVEMPAVSHHTARLLSSRGFPYMILVEDISDLWVVTAKLC